ncbi:hypothetical protein GUITHDRAFT_108492 [Guillardia theta CCMP2712]|uniref:Uncharacterized protein n=1 Tax=Guillardia theta (strain CCMP2712) TaxID=905079 RepID=L1JAR0_GUITC|nr:hypothetical protein GUITHDRAFT_108492 [Guillardia theta CCMP2712]EKX45616.1 hypothetical protein GUITHDRAFT_108492 [Guillardia theta CCMP2712]|eukprot:XP_005832596.1 hypothetical protein GUITHDRAFT_108492 [Guillardia theta CCMP2712]
MVGRGTMGGVISAGAVAFSDIAEPVPSLANAVLRASVMGGAWSCSIWTDRMKKEDAYIAGEAKAAQAVNCLHEYCYYENLAWASISCLTAVVGSAAASCRSKVLTRTCLIIVVLRGIYCASVLVFALVFKTSCPYWALSKSSWIPLITFAHVVAFAGLLLRFSGAIESPESVHEKSEMEPIDMLSDLDWEVS